MIFPSHGRGLLKRGLPAALIWIGLLCITASCGSTSRLSSSASDGRPKVLTTFTILADMARNVAGDRLQVESITKPGAEIHGYEFTPSDIERASGADLIVENGLGLELWARRFTEAAGDVPTVTLTTLGRLGGASAPCPAVGLSLAPAMAIALPLPWP